ncbi:MAG: 3-dehydroquinate synthase [Bacteroidales bacterium]|jgi:3-dehydroquinate synthase|nr:3-dehydroquinate synthase [Bacteroidales bacterium]
MSKKNTKFAAKFLFSMTITTDIDLVLREQTALTPLEQVFVLVDENTRIHALPLILQTLPLPVEQILCIPAGETHKTLHTVELIWQFLEQRNATKRSILLCVGGGVLTDMGGFAAATFKRGITWINIPTTLLGMVDAAAGGKTGFNYGGFKNEIGLIREAKETIIDPDFLNTLPPKQFLSGFAEMIKHALISSPLELASIRAFDPNHPDQELLKELISRSVDIKNYIVDSDPEETGMRQTLNFGHTIGHAIEEYSLRHDEEPLLHGYAVLYGMVAELYLSVAQLHFPERDLQTVVAMMKEYYGKPVCPCKDYDELISLMQHDKKNPSPDRITFTLLRSVGNYQLGCTATEEQIKESLDFLFNC